MKRALAILLALIVVVQPTVLLAQDTVPPWRRELPTGRAQASIVVGESEIQVDLAIQPGEQQLGLGYRNGLGADHGMLFLGQSSTPKSFWMKGMRFCLDIIWIEDGEIVGAAESVCPDPEGTADADRARFSSGEPVTHVLEMPAGWLQENGYGPGTPVDLGDLEP